MSVSCSSNEPQKTVQIARHLQHLNIGKPAGKGLQPLGYDLAAVLVQPAVPTSRGSSCLAILGSLTWVRKAAAVSKLIFRKGDVLEAIPKRLQAL